MAENKKSFLLYVDQISLFETLTDEEAGKLIKHIFRYVNDLNPEIPDRITQIGFEPIKYQLKRDLIKYKEKIEQSSEAGKASAEARRVKKLKELQQNSTGVNGRSNNPTDSTVKDTVIDTDTEKDFDYYIVGGKIEKGNLVDWYLKNQQPIFESILMQNSLGKYKDRIILDLRVKFINGYSFNDYKHISNSVKKFIIENSKTFIPQKAKLVR